MMLYTSPANAEGREPTTRERPPARVLVMGDSLLAAHALTGRGIAGRLQAHLGETVRDHSVVGARMLYPLPISGAFGLSIPKQFRKGEWEWVVLNGGGNDLWLGCGCTNCDRTIGRLISEDGAKGEIPRLVARIRATGAQVLYLGYMRSPGRYSPIESCAAMGAELETRIEKLAGRDRGVAFHSLADLMPQGDLSYHGIDRIHPSLKASDIIARRLARIINRAK